ncbi:hypothetical protein D3C73_1610420 [compost metagenome]
MQVVHHCQCHGLVTLLRLGKLEAVGMHLLAEIEHGRKANTGTGIAHGPAIVVVQVVGVPQQGRLPIKTL